MKTLVILSFFIMVPFFTLCAQDQPTTRNCQNTSNDRVRRDCIAKEIQAYAQTSLDISKIANYAKIGVNKIYTRFKVTESAQITEVQAKATSPELEIETIRTLMAYDGLIPGKNSAKTTSEFFTMLIVVTVDEDIISASSQVTGTID